MNSRNGFLAFAIAVSIPIAGSAQVEQCRHIGNRAERNACYTRQDAARQAAQKAAAAKPRPSSMNLDEQLRLENERLSSRLKSICKGC